MARGPRKLRVSADAIGLTQFGGVALIEQFFQRIGLQGALWRHVRFAQRNHRYSISESLKALLYPLVLGLGRIETTEPLKDAYALGKIPTKDFLANEAFFQIVLLAYNLLNWFKRLCVP
ncbi:MAG: hypothetical protein HY313_11660, partial [Acidobacteria bacterium]|nr:hypothetical protein [Acidobacteriota bacterium]